MERPKWPKLRHTNPTDLQEHALSLGDDFKAIQKFLRAGLSIAAPTLPKGIEYKIKQGIARGLVEVESRDYSDTSVSVHRDLISNTIFEDINANTAPSFHARVPQYLFTILQDSYNELCLKLVNQNNAARQNEARMAGISEMKTLPQTPPQSPPEQTDSELSIDYGSDTEGLIIHDRVKDENRLNVRASKLKAQLQEVERERKAASQKLRAKAKLIKNEIEEVELEDKAAERRESERHKAMQVRRMEQDRTGDYGTEAVGYNVSQSADDYFAKQELTARSVTLRIQTQVVVNRLFNMSANVLMRKVKGATIGKTEPVDDRIFPSITCLLGAELLDDGNVMLWANSTDDYDFMECRTDAFDKLQEMPSWDQAIFARFANHLTEPSETFSVEVKDIAVEVVDLRNRKQKAAVITDFVKHNLEAIPSLHIDVVKDIRFPKCTTNDNTQALVLDFSNAATANEVICQGLQWNGRRYCCEVFDIRFLDRCGHCQAYGHHADTCSDPPRCGKCTERHRTKYCKSSSLRCALCDGPHRPGSRRCQAKGVRLLDKFNARFPLDQNEPPNAVPPKVPKSATPPLRSPPTQLPAPQIEHVDAIKERHLNPKPIPIHTVFSYGLPPAAQQLQDRFPALEAALEP